MSNIINVQISHRQQYNIWVGQGLSNAIIDFCSGRYSSQKAFIVIDQKVDALYGKRMKEIIEGFFDESHFIVVPEGEASKSVEQWNKIVTKVLEQGVERNTPLLTVGGGVTGDLGGFVASSVLRGIPLIHIPTSLLAMVDSSIGGKTGVNHDTGKNLIGAFYQPDAVFTDVTFLETLEQKEWVTGMAEILKYAAIRNPELFNELEVLAHGALTPGNRWVKLITESARIKIDIVQEDALEAGKRAYLNFGHTFGHALENVAGYGNISHGEAVFVGMIAATHFSRQLGYPVHNARFAPFLSLYKQQMNPLPNDIQRLIETMKSDKKVKDNTLRLVLLNDWGSPYIYECNDYSRLQEAWKYALAQFN
ncbi:MAG: 3-dehydroquinate synthase [Balneolaceae bacterium]|jgi:3-dehydroquinate synthase